MFQQRANTEEAGLMVQFFFFPLPPPRHLTAVSVQAGAKLHCVNEAKHQCKLSWGSDAALAEKTSAVKCRDEQQTFPVHKSPSLSPESLLHPYYGQ